MQQEIKKKMQKRTDEKETKKRRLNKIVDEL